MQPPRSKRRPAQSSRGPSGLSGWAPAPWLSRRGLQPLDSAGPMRHIGAIPTLGRAEVRTSTLVAKNAPQAQALWFSGKRSRLFTDVRPHGIACGQGLAPTATPEQAKSSCRVDIPSCSLIMQVGQPLWERDIRFASGIKIGAELGWVTTPGSPYTDK